jgi:hypothetical protein
VALDGSSGTSVLMPSPLAGAGCNQVSPCPISELLDALQLAWG